MTKDAVVHWHSWHIYYYGDQDALLARGVQPVIAPLLTAGVVKRFFFLRYWQGGPHVRLRVLAPADLPLGPPAGIDEAIRGYLRREPGVAVADAEILHDMELEVAGRRKEEPMAIVPGDCVRAVRYEPEYDKYGGPEGVKVAEELFHHSSEVVLDTIGHIAGSPRRRLGMGFLMTFCALRSVGLDGPAIADFFAHYCRLWAPWAVDDRETMWRRGLEEHRATLVRQADALLAGNAAPEHAARWEAAIDRAWSSIRAQADTVLPYIDFIGRDAPREHREKALLASYIHTHNNRLGVIPGGEAYLAYLGHHAVSAACGLAAQDLDAMASQRQGAGRT